MIPDTLGACADRLYELRAQKQDLERSIKALDEERRAIEEHLIQTLSKSDASGIAGRQAKVRVVTEEIPTAKDWPAIWQHIAESGQWDLLQKRLSSGAAKARWAEGEAIPGVEPYTVVKVSVTKI